MNLITDDKVLQGIECCILPFHGKSCTCYPYYNEEYNVCKEKLFDDVKTSLGKMKNVNID